MAKDKTFPRKTPFIFFAPEAKLVSLVGNFNHWDELANPMKKNKTGEWKTSLALEPGVYQYRFLVDGTWESDPLCDACVPNEFGSRNCVRIVA
jgi:1,4-alpha-glucan branching enzyme